MSNSKRLSYLSKLYSRIHNVRWQKGSLLHVAIECWPGFTINDWLETLNNDFSEWENFIEIGFINNSLKRYTIISEMDVYVSTWLTSDLLNLSPRLKWVQLLTAGVDFLEDMDIDPNIMITTVSGIASSGVAEHVIGIMIALDRRFDLAFNRQKKWIWQQDGIIECIQGLSGRIIGIVGLGNIGRSIATLARAMGMTVIGMSKHPRESLAKSSDVDIYYGQDGLMSLLEQADFAVLCVPLNKETKGMIGRKELVALGKDSYLINVARGDLIDENALNWALRKKVIAGAALDVLSVEPPPSRHPLNGCPNLIITPHIAGNIYTFRKEVRERFSHNLQAFLNGSKLEGLIKTRDQR